MLRSLGGSTEKCEKWIRTQAPNLLSVHKTVKKKLKILDSPGTSSLENVYWKRTGWSVLGRFGGKNEKLPITWALKMHFPVRLLFFVVRVVFFFFQYTRIANSDPEKVSVPCMTTLPISNLRSIKNGKYEIVNYSTRM